MPQTLHKKKNPLLFLWQNSPQAKRGLTLTHPALGQFLFVKLVGMGTIYRFIILNIFSLVYINDNMIYVHLNLRS